jgi:hypothetical protein
LKKNAARYIKTNLFDYDYFKNLISSKEVPYIAETDELNYSQTLITRLKKHNVELLEGLGELELYKTLWETHPSMKSPLRTKYMERQEINHVLKGKINALGELLKSNQ